MKRWTHNLAATCAFALSLALPAHGLGLPSYVLHEPGKGALALVNAGKATTIYVDGSDHAGVVRAATDLQSDIERVTSVRPKLEKEAWPSGEEVVIVGTIGKSRLVDGLLKTRNIDVSAVKDRWEGYLVQVVLNPLPGVHRALLVAGSDKRGTIFGIYEISEQIGVSPWYWWADVPVKHQDNLFIAADTRVTDAPVVKYRGIFINDEYPALGGWARGKFGGLNHEMYAHVFELILRLKGNYLWPAMWRDAFFDDDPRNGSLAQEYGIVMGTSHHEPLMRDQVEWHRHGSGPWDYERNGEKLREFWTLGAERSRGWDSIFTVGMRGDGDKPMSDEANVALLEKIVADQREILAKKVDPDVTRVPQAWMLYKEVQEYYERGMRVPDDVTLLWCDDNFANIRRLPTPAERNRGGGAGIYYHFDYFGGPRSYKWINVTPLPKIWEQMHLAWKYDATRIWIVNVGDIKPMEVPIEFFLAYAWNPSRWPADRLREYLHLWATREFGPKHAADIADIVAKYAKYNGLRKPEALDPNTFSLVNYREAETRVSEFNDVAERARQIAEDLAPEYRDAFYELVFYPARAAAVVNEINVTAGLNRLYASQGRATTNEVARYVRGLFTLDAKLASHYNLDLAGGKWAGMMTQTHLGYTTWSDPPRNVMPAISEIQVPKPAEMGIVVEGSELAGPGRGAKLVLPALDAFDRRTHYFEIFNRGEDAFAFEAKASEPWIVLSKSSGNVDREVRIEVGARWSEVPPGAERATVTVTDPAGREMTLQVPIHNPAGNRPAAGAGFVETAGVVSIEAEHYAKANAPKGREWLRIPDFGRSISGMTTMPAEAPAATLADAMSLEYKVHLFDAGKVTVHAVLSPTQKFQPGPGFRYAVSFDDEPPQVVNIHADESKPYWSKTVLDGVAEFTTSHTLAKPGAHVLRFWALDPGVVLEKLVVDAGGLLPSYLGPPESPRL
ncbi:MAG TPA: glycosyl hydrolase 115 family protein [Usitatibacter sp.]|nr:glycosyl hydrolase 115 family protein [Usitatibacter sp.]